MKMKTIFIALLVLVLSCSEQNNISDPPSNQHQSLYRLSFCGNNMFPDKVQFPDPNTPFYIRWIENGTEYSYTAKQTCLFWSWLVTNPGDVLGDDFGGVEPGEPQIGTKVKPTQISIPLITPPGYSGPVIYWDFVYCHGYKIERKESFEWSQWQTIATFNNCQTAPHYFEDTHFYDFQVEDPGWSHYYPVTYRISTEIYGVYKYSNEVTVYCWYRP